MRDSKGRFSRKEEALFTLKLPSIKSLISWILILTVLMPWLVIIFKINIIPSIFKKFEEVFINKIDTEKEDQPKKNGLFY